MTEAPLRPVVDVCGVAYDADCWRVHLQSFAENAPGYLRHFAPAFAYHAGVDSEIYEAALVEGAHVAAKVLADAGFGVQIQDHVEELRALGVRHQVLHGGHARLNEKETVNDRVAGFAAAHPDLLTAWAGLDPANPDAALAELDRCVNDLGMRGATVVPFAAGVDPDSPGCHRIYRRCAELEVPLWIHTGMNLAANRPLHCCTWEHIDRIAVAHPTLVVIAGHGGWPWITEAMAVLQRHDNVFLEFSAHRPAIMGKPGSGWEPLLLYGRTLLRHKILFGTAGFVHRQNTRELADEVVSLGLGESTVEAWLHANAVRILGL